MVDRVPRFLKYSTVSTRTCDSIIDMWFWTVSQKQDSVPIQLKEHPIVRHEYTNIVFDMQITFLSQRHWSHTDYMCCRIRLFQMKTLLCFPCPLLYVRLKNCNIMPWQCPPVRPSVRPRFRIFCNMYAFQTWYIHSVRGMSCQDWVSSQSGPFALLYSPK